ncbi:hypothetical protein [Caulobacter sp. NIBR1757]|uniref:hypothetical protein n=1 Tax=Caulobacter sp. NIBR1757 TaxID=3016000 RepID=UPI0022F140D1|nr:hypothetical protein [Caulobacter sp. NIBR1757]WGM40680.1 hypothetical protein AMEJIAPC_03627 [Caulobacter sp. NIBR1757]
MSQTAALKTVESAQSAPHRLSCVLDGIAYELDRLQTQALRLQDVCNGPDPDPVMVQELQALDLMTQSLSALAQFVWGLIDQLPNDIELDLGVLLSAVPLHDLAGRLAAGAAGTSLIFEDPQSGDFDLF